METEKSTKARNWDDNLADWVWNPQYKGSLAAAEQTTVTVEYIYESTLGGLGAIVAVSPNDSGHFLYTIAKGRDIPDCIALGIDSYNQLLGKTLEAYVSSTTLVGFHRTGPRIRKPESWNGVL